MRACPIVSLLLFGLLTPGCVSYWRGEEMETDIKAMQGEIEQLREDQSTLRKTLDERLTAESTKAADLEAQLGRLQGSNADKGVHVDQLQQQVNELMGKIAELKNQMQKTQASAPKLTIQTSAGGTPLPQDEAALYRYGWEKKRSGECDEAIRAFAAFANRFPKKSRADNAIFLMADCLHGKKDYTASIRALQTILQGYEKGDKVDDALVLMFDNFLALKRCKDAMPFLETLIADYPRSNRQVEAKRKLKRIKRRCR